MPARARPVGRPGGWGVGLFVLALWLQALAPALSARMVGAAQVARALAGAVLCGHDGATADAVPGLPASRPMICDDCPFCHSAPAAPLVAPPDALGRRLVRFLVPWAIPPPGHSGKPPRPTAQPRAPPIV